MSRGGDASRQFDLCTALRRSRPPKKTRSSPNRPPYANARAIAAGCSTISRSIQCAWGAGVCLSSKSGASSARRMSSDVPPARTTPISPSCLRGDGVDASRRGLSTRSEWPRNRNRNHPRPRLTDTSRVDGVKAPQHRGTPRSYVLVIHTSPGPSGVRLSLGSRPGVVVQGHDVALDRIEGRTTDSGRSATKARLDDVGMKPEGLEDLGALVRLERRNAHLRHDLQ